MLALLPYALWTHLPALEVPQVPEEAADMLAQYQRSTAAVRSDRHHKLALARTFVPPGRCALYPASRPQKSLKPLPLRLCYPDILALFSRRLSCCPYLERRDNTFCLGCVTQTGGYSAFERIQYMQEF